MDGRVLGVTEGITEGTSLGFAVIDGDSEGKRALLGAPEFDGSKLGWIDG